MRSQGSQIGPGEEIITKVISWTTGTTSINQRPFVRVSLEGGITWTGWIGSEKSQASTIKTLNVMGFKGKDLSKIQDDKALDVTRDVIAVIGEVREWNGMIFYNARFINRIKKKGFQATPDNVFKEPEEAEVPF